MIIKAGVLLCYFCSTLQLISSEIITLRSNKTITCVTTEEDLNTPLALDPPSDKSNLRKKNKINFQWTNDTWRDQKLTYLNPIDSRWTELENIETDQIFLEIFSFNNIASFSVCKIHSDQIFVSVDHRSHNVSHTKTRDSECGWQHYKIRMAEVNVNQNGSKNYHLFMTQQYESKDAKTLSPKTVTVRSETKGIYIQASRPLIWKLHNYVVKSCDTKCNKATSLIFQHQGPLCVSFLTSLGKPNYLKVTLKSGNHSVIQTLTHQKAPFEFDKVEMKINAVGATALSFFGGSEKITFSEINYWQVSEINYCNSAFEVADAVPSSSGNQVCTSLTDNQQNKKRVKNYDCKKRGEFGRHCTLSCKNILGNDCQFHRICLSRDRCFCAFGLEGRDCQGMLNIREITKTGISLDHDFVFFRWLSIRYKVVQEEKCLKPKIYEKKTSVVDKNETFLTGFRITSIQLFMTYRNKTHLLDHIDIDYSNVTLDIDRNELPLYISSTNLTTSIKIITPPCENLIGNLSYTIDFVCQSLWCLNETLSSTEFFFKDHINRSDEIILRQENLSQFTYYLPVLRARRKGRILEKRYPVIKTSGLNLKTSHLSVYCVDEDALWIRWTASTSFLNISKIYFEIDGDKKFEPNFVQSTYSRCSQDSRYVCDTIRNLTSNTNYTITVYSRTLKPTYKYDFVEVTSGTTAQKILAPVQDVVLDVSSKLTLSWTYSPLTQNYCSLQEFQIKLSGENSTQTFFVEKNYTASRYSFQLQVKVLTKYNVSLAPVNKNVGQEVDLELFLYPLLSNSFFDSDVLVEKCTHGECFLTIGRPKSTAKNRYQFLALNPESLDPNENITESICSNSKIKSLVTRENFTESDNGQLELRINNTNKLSTLDKNYLILLVSSSDSNCLIFPPNPIFQKKTKTLGGSGNYFILSTFIGIALVLIALSLVFAYFKYKKMKSKNDARSEDLSLLELRPREDYQMPQATKISVCDLDFYIRYTLSQNPKENRICNEFKMLEQVYVDHCRAALDEINIAKNRYRDSVPFDFNRVTLSQLPGMGLQDYINASYIDGFDTPRGYIVAQSPKFSTVKDFWRMIWLEDVKNIVMATDFIENKERKCIEYWPQSFKGQIFECAAIKITLEKLESYEHFTFALLQIEYNDEKREIRHFHLKWNPGFKVPLYSNNLVPLLRMLRLDVERPLLVHCSSGGSRSAVIILCDLALEMAENAGKINFYKLTKKLKEQRLNMLQKFDQYVLVHLTVSEYLMQENLAEISRQRDFDSVIDAEMGFVKSCCLYDQITESLTHRNSYDLPLNCFQIANYDRLRRFLTTKLPSNDKSSLYNFWNLIIREKIKYVLFLNKCKCNLISNVILPSKTIISVTLLTSTETDFFVSTTLIYDIVHNREKVDGGKLTVIQLRKWPQKELFPSSLLNVFYTYHHLLKTTENNDVILVACHDGITACGLFSSICYLTDKMSKESEIDVCNAIRTVSRAGLNYNKSPAQVKFLHEAAVEFKEKFDPYYTQLD